MAETRDDPHLFWVDPEWRGIIPLDAFHVPRRLRKTVRQNKYAVIADRAFEDVMARCGAERPGRSESWINPRIHALYGELHRMGYAHSVEVWSGSSLIGGLYGIALGAAFFGESMFSDARDASKIALVHLVARLTAGGFTLLDTQFITDHLQQFGTIEISRAAYHSKLNAAVQSDADFYSLPVSVSGERAMQSITQTS